ncbi:hypothetical protein B9Z55_029028 [Caenorhabditis nigoni]|nr:hypothetical protein B9Z55_029028 [Caenorhabditis nigoni]
MEAHANPHANYKVSFESVVLYIPDLMILENNEWYNDKILSIIGEYLMIRIADRKVHVFMPPETEMIRHAKGEEEVDMYFSMLEVHLKPVVAFIVNNNEDVTRANGGTHWSLLVFDRKTDDFYHFDSANNYNHAAAEALVEKTRWLVGQKDGTRKLISAKCLQQENGKDCGVYVANFLHALCEHQNVEDIGKMERIVLPRQAWRDLILSFGSFDPTWSANHLADQSFHFSRADTLEPEEDLLSIISSPFSLPLDLTDEDRVRLKDLRKTKIHKIWASDLEIATSLVDILFAYCYDQRVNQWETNCESGWTCSKLSPSLSYFVKFGSVKECLISSIRRSLTYPLYRNFSLSSQIINDVCHVISAGRTALLHILCDLHRIFIESGEFRYILNDLFITDYIFWIQSVPEDVLKTILKEIETEGIQKEDVGWDLEILETEARIEAVALDSDDEPDN